MTVPVCIFLYIGMIVYLNVYPWTGDFTPDMLYKMDTNTDDQVEQLGVLTMLQLDAKHAIFGATSDVEISLEELPPIEIITENEFFDYEAKYQGLSREVCPAQIPDTLRDQIQDVSKKIYAHLGCAGIVRVDYICAEEGLYFLEVNTIPGMTAASLVPQMVRAAGMDMTNFLTSIIEQ